MALLGVLSILQIVFLPGYLLVEGLAASRGSPGNAGPRLRLEPHRQSRPGGGARRAGDLSAVRRVCGLHCGSSHRCSWLERRWLQTAGIDACRFRFRDFLGTLQLSPLRRVLWAAAMVVIAGFALASLAQFGQIFQQWDAVISWNRWAIDWSANRLPTFTSLYPQLLPRTCRSPTSSSKRATSGSSPRGSSFSSA